MSETVHLGYEVGSAKPVEIPIRNMVIVGQTQEAGKTTTLEALIARSGRSALAFVTKRGERSFARARGTEPYFRERADWQFVASVLEATLREKMKFERNWIIKASKGARTLSDVQRNVRTLLKTAKGISEGVFTTLDAYLDIVVPRIAKVRFAPRLDLHAGVNVLDLANRDKFPSELQSLVMRSCMEWIYEHEQNTITIIPEAWEFIPQGRGSPVKLAAIELIRKGSGLKNYVWLDSQDIGGVDKELLRSCPVWLLGVQREANEIKRVLDNIPAGVAKPTASAVAQLENGQFYACWGKHVVKTYVQPTWMTEYGAISVAKGQKAATEFTPPVVPNIPTKEPEDTMSKSTDEKLDTLIGLMTTHLSSAAAPTTTAPAPAVHKPAEDEGQYPTDDDALYQRFKLRLMNEAPALLKVLATRPEIQVTVQRTVIETDLTACRGMVAKLIVDGFFDSTVTASAAHKELGRRWNYRGNAARVYEQCDQLTALGFLTKESSGYQAVPDFKSSIVERD